jgi:hypothetical protein
MHMPMQEILMAELIVDERRRDAARVNRDRGLAEAARQARRRRRPARD